MKTDLMHRSDSPLDPVQLISDLREPVTLDGQVYSALLSLEPNRIGQIVLSHNGSLLVGSGSPFREIVEVAVPDVISGPVLVNRSVSLKGFPGIGGSGETVSWVGRKIEDGLQSVIVA